jgi:FKBP-type peptidyl-prolyl cis-trans isomerase 2
MSLQKKDFIEIEFTARLRDGGIFDSNIAEDLKKTNLNVEAKPFIYSLGGGMFLGGVDDFLIGKEIGKYKIELNPEHAFGKRDPKFIQRIPIKVFAEQKINPAPGYIFNFDGKIGKVIVVSGGRVLIDFNNPLAGKDVIYDLRVLRKIDKIEEKINALNDFIFTKKFDFKLENKKLILKVEKDSKQFVKSFKDKYKELLDLDLEVEEKSKDKKEEN